MRQATIAAPDETFVIDVDLTDDEPVLSSLTEPFVLAMAGDPDAIQELRDMRLIRQVPAPDAPGMSPRPRPAFAVEDPEAPGVVIWFDYANDTLGWRFYFPAVLEVPRERPAYRPEQVILTLMRYQTYQDHALDRGSDAQVTTIAKRIDIHFGFGVLSNLERQLVFLHYMHGVEQKDLATLTGKSRPTVCRMIKAAIGKMTDYINNFEAS